MFRKEMMKNTTSPQRHNGFTLIELVIVIVILGVLAAVALPKFVDLSFEARQARAKSLAGAIASASAIDYGKLQLSRQRGTIDPNDFFQAGDGPRRSLDADVSSIIDGWSDDGDPKFQLYLASGAECLNSQSLIDVVDMKTNQTLATVKAYCLNPRE